MKTREVETIEGFEAVATYGTCVCEIGTVGRQLWNIVRTSRIRFRKVVYTTSVECANCGRPPGAKETDG